MNEADLQRAVTDMMRLLGWSWYHARPGRTVDGWRTPGEGPLAKGWPDLAAFHDTHGILFVELKGTRGRMRDEQDMAMSVICGAIAAACRAGVSVYDPNQSGIVRVGRKLRYRVWTPAHLDDGSVERELRGA